MAETAYRSFMDLALAEAARAAAEGEVPVGAVVVEGDRVVATGRNRTLVDRDPTAHAEVVALREAGRLLGSERLIGCDLWVTLEPCPMCAGAISFARIRRLYYGAADPKGGAVENGVRLYSSPSCHHVPEVYSGLAASQASVLLKGFFRDRR